MRAIVYTEELRLDHRDVPEPVAEDGEVIVEVAAVGVCGSELHGVRHPSPFRVPPLIMGHEFSGWRADTGARVVVNPLMACGRCDLCARGLPNVCRRRSLIGINRAGGFAERVAVPLANLVPVSESLDAAQGTFVEPLANAVHAASLVASGHPARVGVIGAGSVGLSMIPALRAIGVDQIEVAERAINRRAVALLMGADAAGDRLEGEFDVVVDAVGASTTRALSVEHARPGGTALWLGLEGAGVETDLRSAIRSEQRILTSFCYLPIDFEVATTMAAGIAVPWIRMVPLDEGVATFDRLMAGATDPVKVAFTP